MAKTERQHELETVDLEGVEILEADVPIHGIGSPPEGDIYTTEDLHGYAERAAALKDELWTPARLNGPPNKAEHFALQPAVGWLDNLRVTDDGKKLVTDVKDVPKKFAEIVKAKGYRTRSVEIGSIKSQRQTDEDGKPKVFENVIKGLAWLGGKIPAVRTLDDVYALYGDSEMPAPDDTDRVLFMPADRMYAEGDLVWSPEEGNRSLEDEIRQALNPGAPPWRFWVRDVSRTRDVALVEDESGSSEAWVVPFTRGDDGTVTLAASADWTKAEQAWVETAKAYEERAAGGNRPPADTRSEMPETKYTDEQRRAFSEATGLEEEKVTDEMLAKAGVKAETEEPPAPTPPPTDDQQNRSFEERVDKLEQQLAEERTKRFEAERRSVIETALRDGKFEPGERESWEKAYEANPEGTTAAIARLPKSDELAREYGSSEEQEPTSDEDAAMKLYEAEARERYGDALI